MAQAVKKEGFILAVVQTGHLHSVMLVSVHVPVLARGTAQIQPQSAPGEQHLSVLARPEELPVASLVIPAGSGPSLA